MELSWGTAMRLVMTGLPQSADECLQGRRGWREEADADIALRQGQTRTVARRVDREPRSPSG